MAACRRLGAELSAPVHASGSAGFIPCGRTHAGYAPENISSASGTTAHGCDRLGIAIGDISGKGMSAALLMASLHASLRGQVLSGAGDLDQDGQRQPPSLRRVRLDCYATLFCAERTAPRARCTTSMADTILLRRAQRRRRLARVCLGDGGPVIGLLAGAVYKEQMLHLLPGDVLLAMTASQANASEDEWGKTDDRRGSAREPERRGAAAALVRAADASCCWGAATR